VDGPNIVSHEGRVYVAEHPAGEVLEELAGLPNLYHTSIVAGVWDIVQTRERVVTYYCERGGLLPKEKGSSEQVSTQAKFNAWVVANGCAGTYLADDNLRLVMSIEGSADEVLKVLKGTSPDANGKRCRTRYGAFPNGLYGANWVCHQTCNSFAKTKWKIVPVTYSVSAALGETGNSGITDIRAACECGVTNKSNHCCVPGEDCCYNWDFGELSGWGYGLSQGWHPTKNWINTECRFDSVAVPIPGWDEEPQTIEVTVSGSVGL